MTISRRVLPAGLLLLLLSPGAARAEKSLHWRSLDVAARLDADGKLHVVERHAMVFTGDWNGGERVFRLFPGQRLSFEGLKRIDPATGAARDLAAGDLAKVDRYGFTNATTLRWRSRLPSDPPFENTELDYEIAYTLSGVLLQRGDTYLLDHNFGLPDASQTIEAFSVDFDLDPAWAAPAGFARRRTAGPLPPGSDVVVRAKLTHPGAGAPSAVRTGTSPSTRLALFGVLLAAVVLIAGVFTRRESSLKRFGSPVPLASIDAAWLEKNIFSLKPEEAGALWDDTVGAPEVTAVLARLTAEEKLETTASHKQLTMRLKAPLASFEGYEKALLAALFFGTRTETSTAEIKAHYKSTGFDPAARIRPDLLQTLSAHSDFQDRSGRPVRWPTFLLLVAGLALLALPAARGAVEWGTVVGAAISMGLWWVLGLVGALFYQRRMDRLGPWALSFLFVPLLFLWGAWRGVGGTSPLPLLVGQLLLQLAIVNNLFNAAKTRQGPKKIARRRELVAARRFFERELSQPTPRMKDSWFPWIVAFGLGPAVDRWFHSFGGRATSSAVSSGFSSASGSSSSTGSSFSGDAFTGGRSGGGGASGSWAVAAGALASGVSAPSSSSGGGGGGGGGGSSGGGGGGGW